MGILGTCNSQRASRSPAPGPPRTLEKTPQDARECGLAGSRGGAGLCVRDTTSHCVSFNAKGRFWVNCFLCRKDFENLSPCISRFEAGRCF